jgi:hypothetical protein
MTDSPETLIDAWSCRRLKRIEELAIALAMANSSCFDLEAENKRLRDALIEIRQLDSPGQCGDIANRALDDYETRRMWEEQEKQHEALSRQADYEEA